MFCLSRCAGLIPYLILNVSLVVRLVWFVVFMSCFHFLLWLGSVIWFGDMYGLVIWFSDMA